MRHLMRMTLQWRITVLVAIVLISSSVGLTAFSMFNAQRTLIPLIKDSNNINNSRGIEIRIADDNSDDSNNHEYTTSVMGKTAKQKFDVKSIIFCFVLTTVGTWVVYLVSGKALQPVRKLSRQVSKIDERDLSKRIEESISKDEVSSLTKSFNKMLERLEQAFIRQKRFSASAAHELKTPLATMKTGIQILRMDEKTTLEEYKENAIMAEKSIDRLTKVVEDLLLLSSTGDEKENLKQEIYLDIMFEAIFSEISPLYDSRDISYEINCGEVKLLGNETLLYRAFYNLIDNAYKYTNESGHISVSVYEENKAVNIDILDNGFGIPLEHLPLVFEAFYRVDASRSRKIAGSGLGLSIVKSIIERHSGTITVSSEKDKGSCFSVSLPK